jgi:hypothetical protein
MVKRIHQSHPHVVAMCRILSRAAENLVYHYGLRDDNELDDIALDLGRYLSKDRKQLPGNSASPSSASSDGSDLSNQ